MAEYDTGLGWLAEEDWLKYVAGSELAVIGGWSDPLPEGPVWDKVTSTLKFSTLRAGYTSPFEYYFMADNTAIIAGYKSVTFGVEVINVYGFSTANTTTIFCHQYYQGADSGNYSGVSNTDMSQYGYSGLYRTSRLCGQAYNETVITADFNVYNTETEMNQAVFAQMQGTPITKDNEGFAVACVVKWKTQNGTELVSPILISSETDYTDMSTAATGNYMAKFNGLLSGVRFYMAFWDFPGNNSFTTSLSQLDLTERGNITLEQLFMIIISTDNAHVIIVNSPDPYEKEGAGSGEKGGDGEELEDDKMGISHHAIPAAINTGFCRIYCPSASQLRDLSNYLWSAQYDIEAVKKLFANPMDSILGLSAVPLTLSGADMPVSLGGVSTGISLPMVSYQSYQVPMGAITVAERWGSYLDYDPYTKFSIYLPFIGFKDLSTDDIMGKQIILDYDVDILSGACTARLQAGGNVLYQWAGQCSIQLPVTASNWNQVFQSATSAALSAGLAVASGSAGPVLSGALAAEGVQAIMGKPRIERGGSSSGAAGWMGGLTPYLVRVTPEAIIPNNQNKFIGYPAFSSISLGALTGYNEISSIHLEGIPATGAELDELEGILKGGVIF